MAASAKFGPQDLPPKDGYGPIRLDRIKLDTILKVKWLIPVCLFCSTVGITGRYYTTKKIRRDEIEMRSARFAITPLLIAERDREFLKQLRRNRDIEATLMKDVPGWDIGTLFGQPMFDTVTDERLITPPFFEFFAHSEDSMYYRLGRRMVA